MTQHLHTACGKGRPFSSRLGAAGRWSSGKRRSKSNFTVATPHTLNFMCICVNYCICTLQRATVLYSSQVPVQWMFGFSSRCNTTAQYSRHNSVLKYAAYTIVHVVIHPSPSKSAKCATFQPLHRRTCVQGTTQERRGEERRRDLKNFHPAEPFKISFCSTAYQVQDS